MNCNEAATLVAAYADGEIDGLRGDLLKRHLRGCASCTTHYQSVLASRVIAESNGARGSTDSVDAWLATGLAKTSVANVYDVQKVLRLDFLERLTVLSDDRMSAVADGLRLVFDLA